MKNYVIHYKFHDIEYVARVQARSMQLVVMTISQMWQEIRDARPEYRDVDPTEIKVVGPF